MISFLKKSKLFGSLYFFIKGSASQLEHDKKYIKSRDKLELEFRDRLDDLEFFSLNKCPCCKQNNVKYSFENPNGFNYDVCDNDGTIYLNPIPTEKSLTQFYESPIHAYNWLKGRAIQDILIKPTNTDDLRSLLNWAPKESGKRLLDIGSSDGSFLLNAKEYYEVQGIELNPLTAKVANNNGIPTFNGRVEDYIGLEEFDVITMLQVIEHITQPSEIIKEVHRLLKDDGLFYINTPNIDSASFNYLKDRHEHVSSFEHVSLFNKESLIRTIEDCGFELIYQEYCYGKDISLHDILSLKISKSKFHHRQALYSPRLFHFSNFFQYIFSNLFNRMLEGNDSYVRAIFRKNIYSLPQENKICVKGK